MIRKALFSDLDQIHLLTQACAKAMIAQHIYQWNEFYPTRERLEADIEAQELYALEENNIIKGIVVLTTIMDEEYIPVIWKTTNTGNLYIHRLAILPAYWGQGYAQNLMDYAEDYAKRNRYQSVRLDTFSENKRNQNFYKKRGYNRLGSIYFPKQSKHPFYCYELVL